MYSELINYIENRSSDKIAKEVQDVKTSGRYVYFCDILTELDEHVLYKSFIHGKKHIERVCFLALILSNKLDLSADDTKLLLTASAYHDIGRKNEFTDAEHGLRAANVIDRYVSYDGDDLKILKASIEAHSRSDALMRDVIDKYDVADVERALRLMRILKDADALDRVRIYDLNKKYLRFDESIDLVDFAKQLFREYR
ncbi:MAG: HD domain-containing protein [Lachnospiraceae bacterium]|nr:HD domain-containing protein [Lachnospiraceae bacterium]